MKAKARRKSRKSRKYMPAPFSGTGGVGMYAIHIDMDEFYGLAVAERSAATDEVVRKYGEFVNIGCAGEPVTFLYRTEEERAIAFCRVKNVFPSAQYASGAVYVDGDVIALLEEKK